MSKKNDDKKPSSSPMLSLVTDFLEIIVPLIFVGAFLILKLIFHLIVSFFKNNKK